jgi:16S rRNA (cytosine1402-N4)-methyltransferase
MDVSRDPVHVPVMLERVVALLAPALEPGAEPEVAAGGGGPPVVVDATLGLGGHAEALLQRFGQVQLVGLDRDPDALARSAERLAPFATRTRLVHAVYDQMPAVLADLGLGPVDGILFDLGVSSMQLDEAQRGFSYANDAPLDMRMNPRQGITAEQVLADYPVAELARILREYGEERFAVRIAQSIDRRRRQGPLTSSAELAELVRTAIPAATRRTGGHPAKRTFQALRIEVNNELGVLRTAIPAALDRLRVGGRIVVLTYHSLEDRIVKQAFAAAAADRTPPGLPVALPGHGPMLRLVGRPGQAPSAEEVSANPRAASARLRAAERLRAAS